MTAAEGNADIASLTPAEGEVPQSVPYLPRWKGERVWDGDTQSAEGRAGQPCM